ncbi:MAG: DUF1638 domain-containing protein [Dehalococcoidales bacterium]|nr:DUF1638 domain-containing protein [Dehalococcoidales bacterium]
MNESSAENRTEPNCQGGMHNFQEYAIVACGTLNMELNYLKDIGFLNARKILYTKPGLHQLPRELERQLIRQINTAQSYAPNIIVLYGGKFCYVNTDDPYRSLDTIIEEQFTPGIKISRIKADHCIDMLASAQDRERIPRGRDVSWMTPGWLKYRHYVYQGWDKGLANENFPKHSGGAIILDATGFFDHLMGNNPEEILALSDWMGIPIESHNITLDRMKCLLIGAIE